MVESRKVEGRVATFRHEAGRGPSLLCIHGAADNHHVYDQLCEALPGRDRYAINLPGRAGSEGPPLSTVREMAAFVSRFAESEIEGEYVAVGHSLGGAVAIEHALASPSRLKAIVLLATGARLRVHPMILELFTQVAESGRIPPMPPGLYERDTDRALIDEFAKHRELTPIETGGTDWRAADRFDRMNDLSRIAVPVLIIAGTEDALTPPKYAEYLAAHIRQSELHVIEGAGHMFPLERADAIAPWIERFVSAL